jgi:hypothetical protein
MPITPVNIPDTIPAKTTSTAQLYNQLAIALNQIMAPGPDGYGAPFSFANTVSTTATITRLSWQQLWFEANQINRHIKGVPISDQGFPDNDTSHSLSSAFVNNIIHVVNTASTNPYTVAPSETSIIYITDVSNPIWDSTITSVIDTTWLDDVSAQRFFNLGGKLQSTLTFSEVFPGAVEDLWIGLITEMQAIMAAHPYNRSLYILGTPQTFSTSVTAAGDHITLTYTPVSPHHITVTVSFIVGTVGVGADSAIDKGLRITHQMNLYRSIGALVAPLPTSQQVTTGFHENGQPIIPTTKILQCNVSSLEFDSMHKFDPSAPQRITLTNAGNSPVKFYFTVFSNQGKTAGPTPTISYVDFTPSTTESYLYLIQPNTSISMDLYYTSNGLGTFNNFLNIWSDSDNGIITIKTRQVVRGPVFRPQIASTSTIDIKSYHHVEGQLAISVNQGNILRSYTKGACSLLWNGQDLSSHSSIFSVDVTPKIGPIVKFNPEAFVAYSGTNTAVLTATIAVNCVSVPAPGTGISYATTATVTTLKLDVPPNQNLGSWISPTSLNNSVVGMSYDIIGDRPYLTIGVGLAKNLLNDSGQLADPLPAQIADAGYNLNPAGLGVTADPKYTVGVPLYKIQKSSWIQNDPITGFLYDYGTWFFPDGVTPQARLVTRRWQFTVPADGVYSWKFSSDVVGYFALDGTMQADSRSAANPVEAKIGYRGTIHLTAGVHTILIAGANLFNDPTEQNGFALTISNSSNQIIWSTLTPIRPSEPYPGWGEVYRIPLITVGTGNPGTYYSSNFLIKDTGQVNGQYCLQDFFGDYRKGSAGGGSLFVITDDGNGDLAIRTQYKTIAAGLSDIDQTLDQLQYVSYYYDTLDFDSPGGQSFSNHARRVHNLDSGPQGDGHLCHQFLGFDSDGLVQTKLTRYPGDLGFDPIPRYLVGSLNLGSTGGGRGSIRPDQSILDLLKQILSDRILQTIGITYLGIGLYTGGIGQAFIEAGTYLGNETIYSIGGWISDTFTVSGSTLAESFIGQAIQSGAYSIGSMFGYTGYSTAAYTSQFTTAYTSFYQAGLDNIAVQNGYYDYSTFLAEAPAEAEAVDVAAISANAAADAAAASEGAALASGASEFLMAVSEACPYIAAAYIAIVYGGRIWHAVTDTVTSIPVIGGIVGGVLDAGQSLLDAVGLGGHSYGCVVATELANQGEWSEIKMLRLMSWAKRKLDRTYLGKTYHRGYQVIGPKVFLPYVRQKNTLMARYFKWSFCEMNDFLQYKKYLRWSAPNSIFWIVVMTATGLCVSQEYAYNCVVSLGPRQKSPKIS